MGEGKPTVCVEQKALVGMIAHSLRYPNDSIHGLLLGSCSSGGKIVANDAAPVCHGAPTRPLVETAIGLVESSQVSDDQIVGWYTSPAFLEDDRPGPVALRMVASLASNKKLLGDPALVVLNNVALSACAKGSSTASEEAKNVVKALGKDMSQQWLETLPITLKDPLDAVKSAKSGSPMNDLADHLDGDEMLEWWPRS